MEVEALAWIIPLAGIVGGIIGWLSSQYWRRRTARRQASNDASTILNERKTLLQEMISKIQDASSKHPLITQLEEVNSALLGLYGERLRHTLKEAGLPPEQTLIEDGRNQLKSSEVIRINAILEELSKLPPFIATQNLLLLGGAYYFLERYKDAKNVYDKVLDLNPYDHVAIRHRGAVYIHMKEFENAVADFTRSLELKPDEPIALHDRGVALKNLKKYKEALDDFNNALELKPDHPTILNNRGITYAKLEQYNEALANFNRSLEIRPDHPDTLYNLACLFSLWGKTDDALEYLEKAIDKDKKLREDTKTDEDFDNIRDDPRFKKLIGQN